MAITLYLHTMKGRAAGSLTVDDQGVIHADESTPVPIVSKMATLVRNMGVAPAAAAKSLDGWSNGAAFISVDPELRVVPPGDARRWDPGKHPRARDGKFARVPGGHRVITGGASPAGGAAGPVPPERFASVFEDAFRDSPYSAFVNHYSPADIRRERMTPLLSADGKAGVLVHDHGDGRVEATALFNHGGGYGAGLAVLRTAISRYGVNYVECFGPSLPKLYAHLGFADDQVYPFDPGQAPANWNTARFDSPDYHTMRLRAEVSRAVHESEADAAALERARAQAQAADPAWWARYGQESWAAALAVAGVTSPQAALSRGLGWAEAEWELLRAADRFDPAEHPRKADGEFARKPGGAAPAASSAGAGAGARVPGREPTVTELAAMVNDLRQQLAAEEDKLEVTQRRQLSQVSDELRREQSRLIELSNRTSEVAGAQEEHRKAVVRSLVTVLGLVACGLLIIATAGTALPALAVAGISVGPLLAGEAVLAVHDAAKTRSKVHGRLRY